MLRFEVWRHDFVGYSAILLGIEGGNDCKERKKGCHGLEVWTLDVGAQGSCVWRICMLSVREVSDRWCNLSDNYWTN